MYGTACAASRYLYIDVCIVHKTLTPANIQLERKCVFREKWLISSSLLTLQVQFDDMKVIQLTHIRLLDVMDLSAELCFSSFSP